MEVSLRDVTAETLGAVLTLSVREDQTRFVASNAVSIAQAHFSDTARFWAIYAEEEPAGFVMLNEEPDKGAYFLWRLMVDARHQGKGYGKKALDLVVQHVRGRPNAKELVVSYIPGPDGAEGFYLGYGFAPTGEVYQEEVVARLELSAV